MAKDNEATRKFKQEWNATARAAAEKERWERGLKPREEILWLTILRAFWWSVRLGFELVGVITMGLLLLAIGWLLAGG